MVMRSMRDGASGGFMKYLLFGLLGMSVGGLVLMDVRGVLSGSGVGSNEVVKIEGDAITIQEFDNTVRRSLSQYRGRITQQQAYNMGIMEEILGGEIRTYFLLNEARKMGIEFDKNRMAKRVAEVVKPNVKPGQSMQDALNDMLRYQYLSEGKFIEMMRREAAGNVIMQTMRSGFQPDSTLMAQSLVQFQNHTRDIEIIIFDDADIKDSKPATDDQLKRLYESLKSTRYKVPEYRTAQMAVFDPKKISVDVNVTDSEIEAYYNSNKDDLTVGEQLVLTQTLVDDEKQAQEIYDLTQEGKTLKEAVQQVIGDQGRYFEKTPFETDAMLPDLLDAVEKIDVGQITEPVKTIMGNHVVLLEDVKESYLPTLDEVKERIRGILESSKKDDAVYAVSREFDEMLDKGMSLEEIQKTISVEISTLGPVNQQALGKNGEQVLDGINPQDQRVVLEYIFELNKGETSFLQEFPSGFLAALILTEKESEYFTPFEDVKDEIAEQFIKDQKHADNELIVEKHLAEIGTGGSTFETIAEEEGKTIQTIEKIGLSGELPAPLTKDLRHIVFQTDVGDYNVLEFGDKIALMKVSGYHVPAKTEISAEQLAEVKKTVDREYGDEMFLMYLRQLADQYQVQVNRGLLEQAYGQQPDESY